MPDLRYPIGVHNKPEAVTPAQRAEWIADIASLPAHLRAAMDGWSGEELATPYRPGGWTVQQLVHHIADSHMHAYLRGKFALTQSEPAILAYDETVWAGLPDANGGNVAVSLSILDGLHARWAEMWRSLTDADWAKRFLHPENGPTRLDRQLALYSWHGRHHTAHITALASRMGRHR